MQPKFKSYRNIFSLLITGLSLSALGCAVQSGEVLGDNQDHIDSVDTGWGETSRTPSFSLNAAARAEPVTVCEVSADGCTTSQPISISAGFNLVQFSIIENATNGRDPSINLSAAQGLNIAMWRACLPSGYPTEISDRRFILRTLDEQMHAIPFDLLNKVLSDYVVARSTSDDVGSVAKTLFGEDLPASEIGRSAVDMLADDYVHIEYDCPSLDESIWVGMLVQAEQNGTITVRSQPPIGLTL